MIFRGIAKSFSLENEDQYNTIGAFWDEMCSVYPLESLRGLGYLWHDGKIYYAIGLRDGDIEGYNLSISLPDPGWESREGYTERLKELYDDIYRGGALRYEIEYFAEDGRCLIMYYR